jgi:hypothetical protein
MYSSNIYILSTKNIDIIQQRIYSLEFPGLYALPDVRHPIMILIPPIRNSTPSLLFTFGWRVLPLLYSSHRPLLSVPSSRSRPSQSPLGPDTAGI